MEILLDLMGIYMRKNKAVIKHTGGKYAELDKFMKFFPKGISTYHEPFVGGGSVFVNTIADKYIINDLDEDLYMMYCSLKNKNLFNKNIDMINKLWNDLSSISLENCFAYFQEWFLKNIGLELFVDEKSLQGLVDKRVEKWGENEIHTLTTTSIKQWVYNNFRCAYNQKNLLCDDVKTLVFLFIKNFAYSGMFRLNKSGGFNVPYGGLSYNKKVIQKPSCEVFELMGKTIVRNFCAIKYLQETKFDKNDFIFIDQPYDCVFNNYAGNVFGIEEQKCLAEELIIVDCKWLMIVGDTPLIRDLYGEYISEELAYNVKYKVNFKNRNDQEKKHLIIKNY